MSWAQAYQQRLQLLADKRSRSGQRLREAWREAEQRRQDRTMQACLLPSLLLLLLQWHFIG